MEITMKCPYAWRKINVDKPKESVYDRFIPCGNCGACRYNYQQDWIFRLRWEYTDPRTFSAAFYTLTIEDEHLDFVPEWNAETGEILCMKPTLSVEMMQKYWKRLRMHHEREFPKIYSAKAGEKRSKIRYYMVGEYGSVKERPHYHAIIFNLHPKFLRKDWKIGNGWVNNYMREKVWKKGMCHFGEVNQRSIAYCAKFHMLPNNRFEENSSRLKEHSNMSKNPYIGNYYERTNGDRHREGSQFYVRTPSGTKRRMPKIYKEKIFSEEERERLGQEMSEELHNETVKEIKELADKGYDNAVEHLRKIQINKEQTVKRHAQSKKGHF